MSNQERPAEAGRRSCRDHRGNGTSWWSLNAANQIKPARTAVLICPVPLPLTGPQRNQKGATAYFHTADIK
ncbi:hypothetical protein Q8A67_011839 [Cirrhinus molitorella]|uniref:Uncharacterized protein n=1 Tax=Cirrhinus molitorella TaxID=172907 RepID=A0AA88Q081_9TELE|nr:hypothetical protein Q8A67_011839 [Cirrhinus molitorella]